MHRLYFLIIALLLVGIPLVLSQEHEHDHDHDHDHAEPSDVVVLGEDNFDQTIENNAFVFVEFYAPWCGHCQRLAPEYEIVAGTFKSGGSVVVAKVDATQHQELGNRFGIRGYPTLKLFRSGIPVDFDGGRTANEMIQWLNKKTGPPSLHLVSQEAYDQFVAQPGSKIVAFVSDKSASVWNSAATSPAMEDFTLAHVTDPSLFGERSVDSAVILKPGEEPVVYSGEFDAELLATWARTEGYPLVDELTQKIWDRSSRSATPLLAVFASTLDDATSALIRNLALKFKGKVLTSSSTSVPLAERWGCSGKFFPTAILVQWPGPEPKMTVYDEESGPFTEESGQAFIEQALKGEYTSYRKSEPIPESNDGPVKIVVGKNFDAIVLDTEKDVFVEFYAPWCGHCKNLAPVWEELGQSFANANTVTIAKMDATANSAPESLAIRGFPTLIFFPADNKAGVPFEGDRSLEGLREFVLQHASRSIKEEL